jgi:hypothetical protein
MNKMRPCPRCRSFSLFRKVAEKHYAPRSVTVSGYVCACGYYDVQTGGPGQRVSTVGYPALTLDSANVIHRAIFEALKRMGRLNA